uniref:Ig-like domain-containing protein n=1 Tax=Solanum lycopersicum TaxID=4081 RepID=A0A3Q7GFN3_SOLLC
MHDNTDMNEDFKLLEPMDLITKSVDELRKIIKEKQHKEKEREHDSERSDVMVLEGHISEVRYDFSIGVIFCFLSDILTLQFSFVSILLLGFCLCLESRRVTACIWREGTLLATGELVCTLNKHKGPIMSLKWNKKGNYLLSGSIDTTAVVWNVKSGESKQQFGFHSGQLLDVAGQNNDSFATSSADRMIYDCKVGENKTVKKFSGHQNEINAINWDPSGSLLASCSDDTTVKEIYTIKWSPTGAGTSNPNQQLLVASASFVTTVKLWDVHHGCLLHSFNGHR